MKLNSSHRERAGRVKLDLETTGSAMGQLRIICAETVRILERRGNFSRPLASPPPPAPTLL